jgi:hypothetical protein
MFATAQGKKLVDDYLVREVISTEFEKDWPFYDTQETSRSPALFHGHFARVIQTDRYLYLFSDILREPLQGR